MLKNRRQAQRSCSLDFGESLTHCAIREVGEETGLQIRITGLIGTYTDPNILIAYDDGEVR
jgi:8-oxo-dGTP diphosphatase